MDLTLVRQGDFRKEFIGKKEVEFISGSDISNISKSALRILYSCGKRPLFVSSDHGSDYQVSTERKPQPIPDCILCGHSNISYQSARILQKQMDFMGVPVVLKKLDSLKETALSEKQLKYHYSHLIRNTFESLAQKGLKHVIVVAEPNKLNTISQVMTNLDSKWGEGIFIRSIKNGKINYEFEPQNPEYITEGMLDTLMIRMVNREDCPAQLKKFSGKVRYPIHSICLSNMLKKRFLEK